MNYKYKSALRVNSSNLDDLEEMLDKYKGSFDEVFFFSQFTHSVKSLEYHRAEAEKLRAYLDMVRKKGLSAGINVLTTIGFFKEALDSKMQSAAPFCLVNGEKCAGKICPSDKNNIEYIKEQYRIYARLLPDIIYVDDDISAIACACPDCISRFAALNSDIAKKGLTGTELVEFLNSEDSQVRKKFRTAWIRYNALRIGEIYKNVETAVHEINPKIKLGAMTYMSGADGLDTNLWAEALSSDETPSIYWRPGGGAYTDGSMEEVCSKANRISAQIRYLPLFAEAESEMENFPYQSLKKSPSFTAFESFIYQAAGCTGTAFNVLCKEEKIGKEHEIFFKMAKEAHAYGELLTKTFGRMPLSGAGFWWDKNTAVFEPDIKWNENKSVPSAEELHRIGIPYACSPDNMSVFFMDLSTAMHIPDEELMKCFSKGILLSGDALDVINRRGFGEYTGFKLTGTFESDTMEQEFEHGLNMPGGHKRNIRQAFGGFGTGNSYTVEKTNDKSEYLAENRDLYENTRGMSAGIFENKLGGRICVEGITPFNWCFSLPRSIHMKNVIRWLSKDTLPCFVKSFHRTSVWSRGRAVFAANTATEPAENISICIKTNVKKAAVTISSGSKITKQNIICAAGTQNGYSEFIIPEIPIIGTALITIEEEFKNEQSSL